MPTYSTGRTNVTPADTSTDLLTMIAASARKFSVHEVEVAGMGTASAANTLHVGRSTGGTTGGGALTPGKTDTDQEAPANIVTCNTTWSSQPTMGDILLRLGFNANGGINRWVARRKEEELKVRNAEQLSFRSGLGTSPLTFHVLFSAD